MYFYMCIDQLQVARGNSYQELHVLLQRYDNDFNLKYLPEKTDKPYCCCTDEEICFNSTDAKNLSLESCSGQCMLRFTLCAEVSNETKRGNKAVTNSSHCFVSDVHSGHPLIIFGCLRSRIQDFFPNQSFLLDFAFPLNDLEHQVSGNISLLPNPILVMVGGVYIRAVKNT